jgi:uncharacterized membrane protein YphA (DoxX/SURF4 family)
VKWGILGIRLVLAGIFLYSGLVKAGASEEFALALVPFTIIPTAWIGTFAMVLTWLEIVVGLSLLVPRVYPLAAAMVVLLTIIFIGALSWALSNGIIVDCGCFGRDEAPSAFKMVLAMGRDVLIGAGALAVIFWWFREKAASRDRG